MTTQSKMFFVKSFKASDLYRGTVWWIDPTYTRRKSIASNYICSVLGPATRFHDSRNGHPGCFHQGSTMSLQELRCDIKAADPRRYGISHTLEAPTAQFPNAAKAPLFLFM